jgi:hypothetical protein
LINRQMPGLYNHECGVILAPSEARVLCSYYADFVSWTEGCSRRGLGTGGLHLTRRRWIDPTPMLDHKVSVPRDTPYPPELLKEMMTMSVELQEAQLSAYERKRVLLHQLRHGGSGEPTAERFWLGQYNEVLVDSEHYRNALPGSLAAVFYVAGGGGESCAINAHEYLSRHYGLTPEQLLLLVHKPGESPAFEEHGRPQGAPPRTLHQPPSKGSPPDASASGTVSVSSTGKSSANARSNGSVSRGGGVNGNVANKGVSNSVHSRSDMDPHSGLSKVDEQGMFGSRNGRRSTSTASVKSSPPQKLQHTLGHPLGTRGVGGAISPSSPWNAAALAADNSTLAGHRAPKDSNANPLSGFNHEWVQAASQPTRASAPALPAAPSIAAFAPSAPDAASVALTAPAAPAAPTITLDDLRAMDIGPDAGAGVRLVAPAAPAAPTVDVNLSEAAPASPVTRAVRLVAPAAPSAPTIDVDDL